MPQGTAFKVGKVKSVTSPSASMRPILFEVGSVNHRLPFASVTSRMGELSRVAAGISVTVGDEAALAGPGCERTPVIDTIRNADR